MNETHVVELAKAMRVSYAYHYGETNLVPWEQADAEKKAGWIAAAEGAVDALARLESK